jgi:uncharacterized protein with ATP-grasp and redox domains
MKMNNACYPCLARGALDVASLATSDQALQLKILQKVLAELSSLDPDCPPPLAARIIRQTVGELTGVWDPYLSLKEKYNAMALELYPWLLSLKEKAGMEDRFDIGVRLAIAGNIIDFASAPTVGREKLMSTISHALETRVHGSMEAFKKAVRKAERILWLGDNAGEIVFDKLLLEEMDRSKIVYAVRGGAIQNDATMDDAAAAGLTEMVRVIDSGAVIPGTLLEYCSEKFIDTFNRADLIISKGQGNFETLDQDSRIFFLLKAKCAVVAEQAGCDQGDVVVLGPEPST